MGTPLGTWLGQCMSHSEWQREHMDPRYHQGNTAAGSKGCSCPQPVLASTQQSQSGAGSPCPAARWYLSPSTASEQWFGVIPPCCQAEGCSWNLIHPAPWVLGTQTGSVWDAQHPRVTTNVT